MDDELTGLTKGCSVIYTLRLLKHLQFCLGKESSFTVWNSWLPRARRMLLPSIPLPIYLLVTRDDKCSSHLANLFPNFKFCSMCIDVFAAESQATLPHEQVWWTHVCPEGFSWAEGKMDSSSGLHTVNHQLTERSSGTTETPKRAFLEHNSLN